MRLPGFIDSHLHVLGMGYVESNIDLTKTKNIQEILDILNENKTTSIIRGRGWNQDQLEDGRMPTKSDLNKVSNDLPIVLVRICGHVLVVNDKMLEVAGIQESTPQVSGGTFDYHTGIFSEKALSLIYEAMPKPSKDDLKNYFLNADKRLIEQGITHVASDDFCIFDIDYKDVIDVLLSLYNEGLMKVKITEQVNLSLTQFKDFIAHGYVNKVLHPKFKMGPLKILADGSLGGRTAAMLKPYNDAPNQRGTLTLTDDELYELIHLADQHQMDSVVHAIGDRTSLQIINAMEKSMNITNRTSHHHAIIHAQLTPKDQILQMKKLGIGAIVQPIFINTDIKILEDRLGNRKNNTYLFHTMYQEIPLGLSTDAPIEPVNPFYNMYTAMTYKSIKYPHMRSLNVDQRFSLEEALKAYTTNNLEFIYESSLSKDDYIIIDRDIDGLEPDEIRDIQVLKTIINGEVVFQKKDK